MIIFSINICIYKIENQERTFRCHRHPKLENEMFTDKKLVSQ